MTASNRENRPESALFSDLGRAQNLALESFGNRPGFPVFLPCHQSLDYALNQPSRALSTSDKKIFSRKGGGGGIAQSILRERSGVIPRLV